MRRSDEPAYCRLELADFSPQGLGIGVRYFGMLAKRLAGWDFDRVTLEAAGSAGSRYVGYIAWAALGAELVIPPDLTEKARREGFPNACSTHDLFQTPEGRRWWIENGSTTEAFFDLSWNSPHNEILEEYMIEKGVDLI